MRHFGSSASRATLETGVHSTTWAGCTSAVKAWRTIRFGLTPFSTNRPRAPIHWPRGAREARSRVEDQLTPEQLERAQRIARGESAEEPELPPISAQDRRFCDQLFSVAQRLARGDKPGVSNPPQKLRRSYLGTDYLSFGSRKAHTYASYDPEDSDYRLRFRLEMPDARALADLMLTCTAQSHPGWSVENYRRSFYWTAENGRQINVRWDTGARRSGVSPRALDQGNRDHRKNRGGKRIMKAKLLLLVGMSGILLGAQLSEAEDLSPVDLGRWLCELTSSSSPEQLLGQFPGSGLSTPRETTERDSGTTTHTWTMTSDGFEVEYEYETERRRRQRHRHLLHIDPKVRYPRGDHIIFGSYEEADQWLAYLGQPTEGRFRYPRGRGGLPRVLEVRLLLRCGDRCRGRESRGVVGDRPRDHPGPGGTTEGVLQLPVRRLSASPAFGVSPRVPPFCAFWLEGSRPPTACRPRSKKGP